MEDLTFHVTEMPATVKHIRAHTFMHTGAAYLQAFQKLHVADEFGSPMVELPLIHMAIELMVKGHATRIDPNFISKGAGHDTARLIDRYASALPIFQELAHESGTRELLEKLSAAWLKVRYGEASVFVGAHVYQRASHIAERLGDEHFTATGIQVFDRHYRQQRP